MILIFHFQLPVFVMFYQIMSTAFSLKAFLKMTHENLVNTIETLPVDQIVFCIKLELNGVCLTLLKQLPQNEKGNALCYS